MYNARKNLKVSSVDNKDDIFELLSLLKEHQSMQGGGFLREVLISSTPCAVLAFDKQLDNLVMFCCQSSRFGVLGVDATFELGDFYVTLTTYRHLFLTSSYGSKPPVLLGPVFIHMERQLDKYHSFFSSLLKLQPQFSAIKAYGTDGEKPLIKALETCFPDAVSLRCFIHKRKNIEEHLKGSSAVAKRELLSDIFGTQDGEVFNSGLVDKESEEAFDVCLGRLYIRWEKFSPGFHKWFLTHQADSFRRCMILPVRERAQLGSPPVQFTNNPNESSNSVVKHWVGFTKSSWPDFVRKLQKLVEAQLAEVDKALYGCGDYSLASEFACFEIDAVVWHRMSSVQRKAHLRKITGSMSESVEKLCKKLSLPAAEVHLSSISSTALKSMWEKAERLLNTPNAVVPAPGSKNAFMVLSDSSSRPHFVQQKTSRKILCDDDCPMWRGRKFCSHAIAVAEHLNCLQEFVQALQKSTPECNLTNLVTTITDRRKAGTKSGAPKKGRKGRVSTPITTYNSRLEDVSPALDEVSDTSGECSVKDNGSKDITVGCYNNPPPHYGSPTPLHYGSPTASRYGSPYGNVTPAHFPLEVLRGMISLDTTCMGQVFNHLRG